jgi:hypothetical protein
MQRPPLEVRDARNMNHLPRKAKSGASPRVHLGFSQQGYRVGLPKPVGAHIKTNRRSPPVPGALGQKLSIVRAPLSTVTTLLLIKLCCKHPLDCLFFL